MNCPGCGWDGFDSAIDLACDGTDGPVAPWTDDEPWDRDCEGNVIPFVDFTDDPGGSDPCYAGEACLIHN